MKEDLYINLIYKKLSGEISPTESGQLEAWLQSSEEHRETLASVSAAWEASADLTPKVEVDLDLDFAALERRIQQEEMPEKGPTKIRKIPEAPKKSNRRIWLAAAGILLLVSALFLVRDNFLSDASAMVEVRSTDVVKELTLSDGSKVTLNKNSSLQYPERFSKAERSMTLTGEAFFEVISDKSKPFKVKFAGTTVEVLGTSFNINARKGQVHAVQVRTGKVKWNHSSTFQVLTAGMTATFDPVTEKTGSRIKGYNADYWRTKQLQFDEIEVKYVLQELEKFFNVQFTGMSNSLLDCRFNANFDDPSLDEILETLATIFDVEVIKMDSTNYQLNGGACR